MGGAFISEYMKKTKWSQKQSLTWMSSISNLALKKFGLSKTLKLVKSKLQGPSQPGGPSKILHQMFSVQFSRSVVSNPMDCSTPGLPVHHQLLELAQTHVHWISDAIQPSHPLSSPSPPVFDLSQHQGLFQWVSSLRQVAKLLEFQLQHQSFQWIFRTDFL